MVITLNAQAISCLVSHPASFPAAIILVANDSVHLSRVIKWRPEVGLGRDCYCGWAS